MKEWIERNKVACLILVIAVIFIVIGVNRNEVDIVLTKAVQICLECIGIG